jgi:glutamate synthase domain-containing protein 2/glutamate synthase domain-containing protein 1/glutamate synthase domain-containing protein 3
MRDTCHNAEADHDACGVGFIAQLGSTGSRDVIERAFTALERLSHRGGVDADGLSGDGAGLLTPVPKDFLRDCAQQCRIHLPKDFGLGMAFLPPGQEDLARRAVESFARKAGLRCLGWRIVPTDTSILGPRAVSTLPAIRQCFFAAENPTADIERLLFLLRKRVEAQGVPGTYFCSLSSKVVVYKGLLTPLQFRAFYADLANPDFKAPFASFHQRYSTNTRPTWTMAQPFRFIAHNGEINTISANRRWMRAREGDLRRKLHAEEWFRALEEEVSDSASFDNALEILLQQGYSLPAAILRMMPPAWEADQRISREMRLFFESEAREQESWDGPAAMVFSDGRFIGAKLDRNGLRPLRYSLTSDGLLVVGSEVGLADLRDKVVSERQRLGPGEMLLVDSCAGAIFRSADEISGLLGQQGRHARTIPAVRLGPTVTIPAAPMPELKKRAGAYGWTEDQFRLLFEPLGLEGKEATWSMGDDAPPAFLSSARRPLWDYCKQRFAQVTNPPIDPLREAHVMSLNVYPGPEIVLRSPVLDTGQIAALEGDFLTPAQRVDITFDASGGAKAGLAALERVRNEVIEGVCKKPAMLLLSDQRIDADRAALPVLLAVAAVWNELTRAGAADVPLIVESGQIIETHHIALLIAAGASAVSPVLAMELAEALKSGGAARYRLAVEAGLRKVLARMGISTVASYRNSHLFETVGLDEDTHAGFFEDAAAIIGGKKLTELLEESLARHKSAFGSELSASQDAGLYRFRQGGELHSNSPELVRRMHKYIKSPTAESYAAFSQIAESREPVSVRDLLEIAPGAPSALDEVESEGHILSRFCTQAMSLGALGPESHRTLAIAMNRLGARSNTGEGGEDPNVYRFEPEAGNRVKQVASARFGVTTEYLVRADELEIKMAQGSKPGEGGQLPAAKVNSYIARLRHAVPGMSLISPPPHHDIYSIEDLAQLIYDLRAVNPRARIGVKLVAGAGVGIIAAGVAKAGADVITISGFDGGTGASPLTSIKNTGLPWEFGLRDAHNALVRAGFRQRVRLRVDGGFKFGRDVIVAALLGADEFGFGTAALLAMGCVMARQCHLNTCPVGIATQDEKFRARFTGNPEMVMAYFRGVAGEVRERLASLGVQSLGEIVGRVAQLHPRNDEAAHWLEKLLEAAPEAPPEPGPEALELLGSGEDLRVKLARALKNLERPRSRPVSFLISNSDRSIGAHLSGQILRSTGYAGLHDQTIECEFRGSAGQSFGAFLISGLRFRLLGEANDYVGKSLSGGTIAITAGWEAELRGDVLAGNTVLYGATSGELYIAGRAGERFAVRNSGAMAVVEGVGQHCCEYMTAGVVILLGPAGINLGSGMTGGLVYALRDALEEGSCNQEFVRRAAIGEQEEEWLRSALREHVRLTGSPCARRLLRDATLLPLERWEPVRLPCSIRETWAPILARWEKRTILSLPLPEALQARESGDCAVG